MGKSKSQKRRVVDYFLSLHVGVTSGPVDEIISLSAKDKVFWGEGATENSVFAIDNPEIFGGDEKEGGTVGIMEVYLGGDDQVLSEDTATRMVQQSTGEVRDRFEARAVAKGSYAHAIPGFRGLCSLFFKGVPVGTYSQEEVDSESEIGAVVDSVISGLFGGDSEVKFAAREGFLWSQNSPYVPAIEAKVRRRSRGLPFDTSMIVTAKDSANESGLLGKSLSQIFEDPALGFITGDPTVRSLYDVDSNPVHMIYECYTNEVWGNGWPEANFDDTWADAAQVLYDEGFGLSMLWSQQTEIEAFVSEIQDHIQAQIFERPDNGLLSIKLIRGGYDESNLFEFNPSNCTVSSAERRSLEDTINEMTITWTNPDTEKEETVTISDLANIAAQNGKIVSDNRNYYGIRNANMALTVGQRDLRTAAYPLFTCQITADRAAADLTVGDVAKLNWPERGITSMLVRITEINKGTPGSGKVLMSVSEDIFGLESAAFETPPTSFWQSPVSTPAALPYQQAFTVPYAMLPSLNTDVEYPEVWVGFLGQSGDKGVLSFGVSSQITSPDGSVGIETAKGYLESPVVLLETELLQEARTVLTKAEFGLAFGDNPYTVGKYFYLGDSDETSEIIQIKSYDAITKAWTFSRGLLDTIPRKWPVGTVAWSLEDIFGPVESEVSFPGDVRELWFRPRTSSAVLPLADAPQVSYVPLDRMHRPHRNANLVVAGVGGFDGLEFEEDAVPVSLELSWSIRNRKTEDAIPIEWGAPGTFLEEGQTTTVRVTDSTGATVFQVEGLTGSSYTLVTNDFSAGVSPFQVAAISVLDGLESFQTQSRVVDILVSGYGNGYGRDYGSPA